MESLIIVSKKGEREVFVQAIRQLLKERPFQPDLYSEWVKELNELVREYLLAGGTLATLQERFPSIELPNN
jgi:hypothetical protein